jgi:hypothetical protein
MGSGFPGRRLIFFLQCGVIAIDEQYNAGAVSTGDHLSLASLSRLTNLSPVSATPVINEHSIKNVSPVS